MCVCVCIASVYYETRGVMSQSLKNQQISTRDSSGTFPNALSWHEER
jgi:hypothetical protein